MAGQTYQYNLLFTADTSRAKSEVEKMAKSINGLSTLKGVDLSKGITPGLKEASKAAAEFEAMLKRAYDVNTGSLDFTKLNRDLQKSGKSVKDFAKEFRKAGPEGEKALQDIAQGLTNVQAKSYSVTKLFNEMWHSLKQTARYQLSNAILGGFTRSIRDAFEYSKELNTSLNDIRIVTGYNVDKMAEFAAEANRAAKSLSTTTNEYSKASLIYFQQGLSDQEVKARADITVKMANVTRESSEQVSQQMTAIWNNFYDGSKSLEYYADVLTKLGAATASSTDEISQGLEKFAATAEAIGLSFEYSTAALATVTAQTRQSADVVGTAFKTMFARIQGLKLGETLDDGTTLNQYSQALAKIGVNIQDSNGNLKDMDSILNEMGEKWNGLNQAQKVATAQQVAGLRQYNQLMALMENWDFFQQNLQTGSGAAGELQNQADIYAESWDAATKRVQAALEGVYSSLINDEFIIDLVNGFGEVVEVVDNIVKGLGGFKGLVTSIIPLIAQLFTSKIANGISNAVAIVSNIAAGKSDAAQVRKEVIKSAKGSIDFEGATNAKKIELEYNDKIYQAELKIQELEKQGQTLGADKVRVEKAKLEALRDQSIALGEQLDIAANINPQKNIAQSLMEQGISQAKANKISSSYTDSMDRINLIREDAKTFLSSESSKDQIQQFYNKWHNKGAYSLPTSFNNSQNGAQAQQTLSQILSDWEIKAGEKLKQNISEALEKEIQIEDEEQEDSTEQRIKRQIVEEQEVLKTRSTSSVSSEDSQSSTPETSAKKMAKNIGEGNENAQQLTDSLAQSAQNVVRMGQSAEQLQEELDGTHKLSVQLGESINQTGQVMTQDWASSLVRLGGMMSSISALSSSIGSIFETLQAPDIGPWETFTRLMSGFVNTVMQIGLIWGSLSTILDENTKKMLKNSIMTIFNTNKTKDNTKEKNKNAGANDLQGDSLDNNTKKQKGSFFKNLFKGKSKGAGTKAVGSGGETIGAGAGGGATVSALAVAAFAVVVAAGVAAGISAIKNYQQRFEKDAEQAEKAAEGSKKLATEAQGKADQLSNGLDNIKKLNDEMNKLAKGTDEWKDKLRQSNDEVLKLLDEYPELNEYVETTADGQLLLNEEGAKAVQQKEQEKASQAKMLSQAAQIRANEKRALADQDKLAREKINSDKREEVVSTGKRLLDGAAIGAAAGMAIGTAIPIIGNIAGTIIGGIGGLILGAVGGNAEAEEKAADKEKAALDKLQEAYNAQGNSLFEGNNFKDALKGFDADLIAELEENKDAVRELIESNEALTKQNQILVQEMGRNAIGENNNIFNTSQVKNAISAKVGKDIGDKVNQLFEETYKDKGHKFLWLFGGGMEDEKAQKEWAEKNGYKWVANLEDNKGKYIIDGQEQEIDDAQIRYELAVMEANELYNKENNIEEQIKRLDTISRNIGGNAENVDIALRNLVTTEIGKTANLTALTGEELEGIRNNSSELSNELGIQKKIIDDSIKSYKKQREELYDNSKYLNEDNEIILNKLNLSQQKEYSMALSRIGYAAGDEVANITNKMLTSLIEEHDDKAQDIASIFNDIDFTDGEKGIFQFKDEMFNLGINIDEASAEWTQFVKEVSSLEGNKGIDSLIKLQKNLKAIESITSKGLKIGDIISKEDYQKIIKIDETLGKYFGTDLTGQHIYLSSDDINLESQKLFEETAKQTAAQMKAQKNYLDTLKKEEEENQWNYSAYVQGTSDELQKGLEQIINNPETSRAFYEITGKNEGQINELIKDLAEGTDGALEQAQLLFSNLVSNINNNEQYDLNTEKGFMSYALSTAKNTEQLNFLIEKYKPALTPENLNKLLNYVSEIERNTTPNITASEKARAIWAYMEANPGVDRAQATEQIEYMSNIATAVLDIQRAENRNNLNILQNLIKDKNYSAAQDFMNIDPTLTSAIQALYSSFNKGKSFEGTEEQWEEIGKIINLGLTGNVEAIGNYALQKNNHDQSVTKNEDLTPSGVDYSRKNEGYWSISTDQNGNYDPNKLFKAKGTNVYHVSFNDGSGQSIPIPIKGELPTNNGSIVFDAQQYKKDYHIEGNIFDDKGNMQGERPDNNILNYFKFTDKDGSSYNYFQDEKLVQDYQEALNFPHLITSFTQKATWNKEKPAEALRLGLEDTQTETEKTVNAFIEIFTQIFGMATTAGEQIKKYYSKLDQYDKELKKLNNKQEDISETFEDLTGDKLLKAYSEYSQSLLKEKETLDAQKELYNQELKSAKLQLGDLAEYSDTEFQKYLDTSTNLTEQRKSDLQGYRQDYEKAQEGLRNIAKRFKEIDDSITETGIKRIKEELKELIDFDNYDTFFDSWQGFEKQLKDISKELDNIGKKLERTVDLEGRNTLRAEERANLQLEISKNEEKAERKGKELEKVKAEARDIYNNTIQKDLYKTYGNYGLPELKADFSNIDEYVTAANEKYAEYQRQWKLASEDERKILEETKGMFWENLKKYIDNTFSTIVKLEEDIDAANSKAEENRIKIYDSYVSEVLDGIEEAEKLAEESLKRLDYRRGKYNSENVFAASELLTLSLEELNTQYNTLEVIKAERAELEKLKEAGKIDPAAYEKALKTINEQTYTALENIRNLNTELSEGLTQALSKAASLIDSELSKFETLDELLTHYETSLELLNRDKEYKTIIKLTEASMENALTELELQKRTLAALEPEKEALEQTLTAMSPTDENYWNIKTQLDQITDLYNDTNSKILSLIEEAAEKANKILETKMEEAADTFNRAISGEVSIDSFLNKLDLMTEAQEKYFDKTNQIYETNALLRKAQQAFDKTDSKMAKEKLLGFSKTVEQLKNQNKLSKFELEAAQKRFEILQAEIALKDAEDAKSQVRLMRNAAGGYSYIFTADEEATEEARQNLDDKNNDYYNFLKDSRADAEKEWYENALRAQEAIAEVDQNWIDGMYKTEQEYEDERAQVQSYWTDRMYQDSKTFGLILEANGEDVSAADEMWRTFKSNFDTYMDSNTTSITEWKNDTAFVLDEIGKNSEETSLKIKSVTEAGDALAEELNTTLFPALDIELKKIQDLVAEYDKLKASKEALVFDAEVATGNAGKAFGYEENKDYMNEALKALASNDVATAKLLAAQRALKLSDLKKQGKEIKEGNFTQEHLISLIENGKESDFKLLEGIVDQPDEILKRFEGSLFKKDTLNSLGDVYDAAYYGCIDIQEKAKELTGQEIEALEGNAHWLIENEAEFFGAQYKELFSDLDDIKKLLEAIIEKEDDGYTDTYNDSIGHMYEDNKNEGVAIWNGTQGKIDKNGIFTSNDGSYTVDTNTGKVTSHKGSTTNNSSNSTGNNSKYQTGQSFDTNSTAIKWQVSGNTYQMEDGSVITIKDGKISDIVSAATGGYTGSWGSEGRLAFLHQKELVLNAHDTENMLDMISIVRDFSKAIDMQALMAAMPTQLSMASRLNSERDKLQQQVSIQATFPNVQDHNEIEEAFNNLINTAAQYANR